MALENLMDELEEKMMMAEDAMKADFQAIRTGKASPALVENIQAEYYGAMTRIKDMAGITTPEPRLLVIQPWDQTAVKAIEKALIDSNLGISPVSDGKLIRLPIPPLSEDRRKTLAKQVKSRAEEAKISIRNARRDGNEAAKKAQKASEITEDELKKLNDDIQKLTDSYIKKIDECAAEKETELMAI